MQNIEQIKARLVELNEIGKAIQAKADAEKRELSADEQKDVDAIFNEFEAGEADIARRERLSAQEKRLDMSAGRVVPPQPLAMQNGSSVVVQNGVGPDGLRNTRLSTREDRARWGFHDLGEFCAAVRSASNNPSSIDQRLITNALSTYGSEGVGADGGFAVPPEWRSSIMEAVVGEDSLLSRTDQQQATGNSITFPVDETTAWQTSGGIQAYWDGEAAAMTQSKPALKEVTVKLHRVTALVPVTDELLQDSAALGSYVSRKAGEKIAFKVNDAILNGTGAGQPLGILNAPATVSIAKEASQTAATFHADNAVKMMARMPAASFGRSAWIINQDVVPQIMKLGFAVTTASGTAAGAGQLYMPPTGLANSGAYGSLLGRPIIVTEACATLGTVGDVVLADLAQYLAVIKAGGVRSDTSIHLFFDQNATAFRFVLRMNGQPWLSAPIARKNGSNTLSHFITLATRA
jgi:HK97 family phage major capsid protein